MLAVALVLAGGVVPTPLPAVASAVSAPQPDPRVNTEEVGPNDDHHPEHVGGHGGDEGLRLAAASEETVDQGTSCGRSAPVREYRIAAVNVDMSLNRYLDHDPQGRMYVLEEDLGRVRAEEAKNAAARGTPDEPAVTLGLQGDAIQPLTLRALPGDCLKLRLRNALQGESASLHLHASELRVAGGGAAVASNRRAMARPGETVAYEWMISPKEREGTHYFHSHGQQRAQAGHGLFGALIVEPPGSAWLDPRTGQPARTGWDAMIRDPNGKSFREYVLYYHEVGDETFQPTAGSGSFLPQVDPLTGTYRPGARALNYRSEPFLNRLNLQRQVMGRFDESLEYSSYGFGDPATPILRGYLGDPVKQRVVHAGPEVFHVHHVHGGAIRWQRQAQTEADRFDRGLDKRPPLRPMLSERTDSQAVGPSESFDVVNECGSGGCQQSAGDFMFHCHVTQHYFAGMWGLWRVYNTTQDGRASTDSLAPLVALPDRTGAVEPAVTSGALAGRTVDWYGRRQTIDPGQLSAWVERQLPPQGTPRGYDASVFDWQRTGDLYVGEPESEDFWPGYRPRAPGTRPPILFDPRTGKLAYPFLRPHFGKRPPFAPNHGPAPFLDPFPSGPGPPGPGESGPGSLCPEGTRPKSFALNAVKVPVPLNAEANLVDAGGQLFVLRSQAEQVAVDQGLRIPLVLRVNAQEDCVDVLLRSDLTDDADDPFSKVSAHIHFMQFDVQGSDGVDAGFNYEQTVRPFRLESEAVVDAVPAGASSVRVASGQRFQVGATVGVGMERDREFEARRITGVDGDVLTFEHPLEHPHGAGELVSAEFVRYRWYPDAQFGTAFFHDHVNAIRSSRHGLYGAILSEPPGSTYHHPHSGAELVSGPIADVRTSAPLSVDVSGSFREFVMLLHDDNPLTSLGRSTGSALNLRVEPLERRGGDPSRLFASAPHGDPATPLLEAFVGDPLVARTLVGANNELHSWHLDGHWFRAEGQSSRSPPTNTITLGISERFDVSVPRAGGPQAMAGDYLYYNARTFKLREGNWGILRVHDGSHGGLQKLPGHDPPPPSSGGVCPERAPPKEFWVHAIDTPLPLLTGGTGKAYVLEDDREAVLTGRRALEPLVLHVNVGDCVVVRLTNDTRDGPVSFHADMLAFDPRQSAGVAAGLMPDQAVPPGSTRTYTYFASPEVGETVALVRDWGDVLRNPGLGLYGAVVVGPEGATFHDPVSGDDIGQRASWRADVRPRQEPAYRDFTLLLQDEDAGIGTHRMPYTARVAGAAGINYRSAPLDERRTAARDSTSIFDSERNGLPATPMLEAAVGDPVRIHVLTPWSEQAQVFSVEGHRWAREPGGENPALLSSVAVGSAEARTIVLQAGAGGLDGLPGDYLYGDHREPYREAGRWGFFRVVPCDDLQGRLQPVQEGCGSFGAWLGERRTGLASSGAVGIAGLLAWRLRRRRRSPTA